MIQMHLDEYLSENFNHGRATVRHEEVGLNEVIPRPYRIPVWNSASTVCHRMSEDARGPYPKPYS